MSTSNPTATRLIRTLLTTYPFLRTNQIWRLATEGFKPVLPPPHQIVDGKVRMKVVSNIREGRRVWVPPPSPSLPHHPFHSTSFLKSKVLASLESQGLIHKRQILYPHRDEEERQAAQKQADKETRRAIRNWESPKKIRKGQPTPLRDPEPPKERHPTPFTVEYAWSLGPPVYNENNQMECWVPVELASHLPAIEEGYEKARRDGKHINGVKSYIIGPNDEELAKSPYHPDNSPSYTKRWDKAEQIELAFREAKEIEKEQIARRQEIRRKIHREQKVALKLEKEADERAGRTESVMRERERLEAISRIESYAKQTGEDVSGWYEELGMQGSWDGEEGGDRKLDFEQSEMGFGFSGDYKGPSGGGEESGHGEEGEEQWRRESRDRRSSSRGMDRSSERQDRTFGSSRPNRDLDSPNEGGLRGGRQFPMDTRSRQYARDFTPERKNGVLKPRWNDNDGPDDRKPRWNGLERNDSNSDGPKRYERAPREGQENVRPWGVRTGGSSSRFGMTGDEKSGSNGTSSGGSSYGRQPRANNAWEDRSSASQRDGGGQSRGGKKRFGLS